MQSIITIQTPILSPREFAKQTGQTERAVQEQLRDGRLPAYTMDNSVKQKDKACGNKKKLWVNMTSLFMKTIEQSNVKPIMATAH